MKASSESGLCAMVISRTGAETDEEDISKILQHSYFNARWKHKTLRKNLFCQEATKPQSWPQFVPASTCSGSRSGWISTGGSCAAAGERRKCQRKRNHMAPTVTRMATSERAKSTNRTFIGNCAKDTRPAPH